MLRWSAWRAQLGADRVGQHRRPPPGVADGSANDTPRGTRPGSLHAAEGPTALLLDPEEHDAVLALFEEAFSEHQDHHPWTRTLACDDRGAGRLHPEDLIVIREDGTVVAAAFIIDVDEIWVDKLAVAASARGRRVCFRDLLAPPCSRAASGGHAGYDCRQTPTPAPSRSHTPAGMDVERSTHWAADL